MTDQALSVVYPDEPQIEGPLNVGRPHVDFDDPNEAENRRFATREHFGRWLRQIRDAVLALLLALIARDYWGVVAAASGLASPPGEGSSFFSNLIWSAVGAPDAAMSGPLLRWTLCGLPVLVLLAFLGWIQLYYLQQRDWEWKLARQKAGSSTPRDCAIGYMQVFRLYARTKRRAVYLTLFGVVAAWWSIAGLIEISGSAVGVGAFGAAGVSIASAVLTGLLALRLTYHGYDISRRYVPGKTLVRRTLILGTMASTSQTPYADAEAQAKTIEAEELNREPDLFYSYPKRPKRTD